MLLIRKLALAGLFTALSIVLDIFFKQILPLDWVGFPYYALPIIVGSIVLGPILGGTMGLVSDIVGFFLFPLGSFNALFSLSAIMWGVIPGLLVKLKTNVWWLLLVIFITHVLATLSNSVALWILFSFEAAVATLPLRIMLLPVNALVLTFLVYHINRRMEGIFKDLLSTRYLKA